MYVNVYFIETAVILIFEAVHLKVFVFGDTWPKLGFINCQHFISRALILTQNNMFGVNLLCIW